MLTACIPYGRNGPTVISTLENGTENPAAITLFRLAYALQVEPIKLWTPDQTMIKMLDERRAKAKVLYPRKRYPLDK